MLSVVCTDFDWYSATDEVNMHVDDVYERTADELCAIFETCSLMTVNI